MRKIYLLVLFLALTACGGGGGGTTTGSGGAPSLTNKCSVSGLMPSSGVTATLNKASDSLSVSMQLDLQEATNVDIDSNFESKDADDWIEAHPFVRDLTAGSHTVTLQYDLNSPKKMTGDRYTKLNVTVRLPGNKACTANLPVNITLTQ